MKEKVLKVLKNPYFEIIAVYFLAHFFMLILSGCWWDDWTFMTHDLGYINAVASQSGRPEWNLLVPLCWSLPNNGRILIFFLYLFISLFVYVILKNSGFFDERKSLYIALIFSVFPVNDARILISNFAYTVGLFLFYLSFMLFVLWNRMENGKRKNICRVFLLISFFFSFILNSVLAYYYIIMAYLLVLMFIKNCKEGFIKRVIISIKDVLVSYPDFFVLPFVYYICNKVFFPTYGDTFGNYNSVTLDGFVKCLFYVPLSVLKVFSDVFLKGISCINLYTGLVLAVIAAVVWYFRNNTKEKEYSLTENILHLVCGVFVMMMAAFPYVMVRGRVIDTMGVKGRDAVLVSLGAAIILYSVICMFKGRLRKLLFSLVVGMFIISCNFLYLEWQKDYYYQLSMERLFVDPVIRDNDTFFLVDLNESQIEGQRYYSLNTNAYRVFKDETRFFVPKVSNLYILEDQKYMKNAIEALNYSHMMKDYKPDDYYFDAVLNYTNYLSDLDVLKFKYCEMFDREYFDDLIAGYGSMDIYVVEDDFTIRLLEKYDNEQLHGDQDVLDLVLEFAGQ